MNTITITCDPLVDAHVHLRTGPLLRAVAPETARYSDMALVMPNIAPPVRTVDDAKRYELDIKGVIRAASEAMDATFRPWFALQLCADTTPQVIKEAAADDSPVLAVKYYPPNVTHGKSDVRDLQDMRPTLSAMEALEVPLCLHAEVPGEDPLRAEAAFIPTINWLVQTFPRLRIVVEHVTSRAMIEAIKGWPEHVGATITAHHLFLTFADVMGARLHPHHFCKPIPKTPDDLIALREAALEASPKFFYGSDSAPHLNAAKRSAEAPPGVYTAPVAPMLLVDLFFHAGKPDAFRRFTRMNACTFYNLDETPAFKLTATCDLTAEEPPTISQKEDPHWFFAGKPMRWQVTRTTL